MASVSLCCKSRHFKQQTSKFYPQILITEPSYHIYINQGHVVNATAGFCRQSTKLLVYPSRHTNDSCKSFPELISNAGTKDNMAAGTQVQLLQVLDVRALKYSLSTSSKYNTPWCVVCLCVSVGVSGQ